MAGVKGRSGGARSNAGGARAGAGRKRSPAVEISPEVARVVHGEPLDPRPTLELIALGHMEVSTQQYKALTALLPYVHTKKGDGGKKEEQAGKAKQAASKFAQTAAPRLAAAGGKRV